MKKVLLIIILSSIFLIGCGKKEDVILKLKDEINSLSSYKLSATLEIINNEDIYKYEVDSAYKKDNLFRVSLKNINNGHEQVLLKNSDGVYVLTPSLNKSFKFQSEWPYNNSQIYLLQTIVKDIEEDNNATVEEKENAYIIESSVDYTNNDSFVKQKVYLDKNLNITKVEVLDDLDMARMTIYINNIDKNPNLSDEYFSVTNVSNVEESIEATTKIDSIIYPMYIPEKTYLESQNKISVPNGERVILTFNGDSPFMLIQETSAKEIENSIIPTYGSFNMVGDTIGVINDNSISWSSNGIDYYVTSNNLSEKELLTVANSVTVLPVGK